MRSSGIRSHHDLSAWLGRQGFPRVSPGNHISGRAQEFVLGEAVSVDARAALLEAVFVTVTIHMGTEPTQRAESTRRNHQSSTGIFTAECWQQLRSN